MKPVLLIVDDEESVRESFRLALQDEYELVFAEDAKTTLRLLKTRSFDLCLLDILLPDGSGLDLLSQMKRRDESIEVIMVTALQGVDSALTAMKGEAYDYITKPFRIDGLRGQIRKGLAKKRSPVGRNIGAPFHLIGHSRALRDLVKKMENIPSDQRIIYLAGEKGTGTEDIALEIHRQGSWSNGPFITFDGSTCPKGRMEKELFGEIREGKLPQIGKLEFADKGTLFVKNIEKISTPLQNRLMNAIAEKNGMRKIAEERSFSDLQVIICVEADSALHKVKKLLTKDLYQAFKQDVLFAPPLRERKADIPLLVGHLLKSFQIKAGNSPKTIPAKVMRLLVQYPWPGNLPELQNSVETMVLFAEKETLTINDVPLDILIKQMDLGQIKHEIKLSLKHFHRQFEDKYIRKVLENNHGNQTQTAYTLGLHRNTLIGKLKQLKLENHYRTIVRKRRDPAR